MLILGCRESESIYLTVPPSDKPVEIKVTFAKQRDLNNIRIGFTAPRDVVIARDKIHDSPDYKPELLMRTTSHGEND